MPNPNVDGRVSPRASRDLGELAYRTFGIVRLQQIEGNVTNQIFGPVTQDPLKRSICVAQDAIGLENRDDVRDTPDEVT